MEPEILFAHTVQQRDAALASRKLQQGSHLKPIVTQVEAAAMFYPAADRHQDYYARNKASAHCQEVIGPHLEAVGLGR